MRALDERYGQPRQLALRELRAIMEMPSIRIGDGRGLDHFCLRVQALVGLLQSMRREGFSELTCGSHVERLLEKLPIEVTLRNGNKSLDTYSILDDGSERTILLHPAAQKLQLVGESESLKLRTVRQDVQTLNGAAVSFTLIPKAHPEKSHAIRGTNFIGGNRELQEVYRSLTPDLQAVLAKQRIFFKFNPPHAPHFGGTWEREILSDNFWSHFLRNDLPSLQSRPKWRTDNPNLQLNTVVLILDPQLPRSLWPVGKVISLHPGKDGRCRVADVQVGDKQYTRPVARLIPLPALPEPP
ncbi:hypothetical protein PO909_004089 [Leuciscus waleckii]